VPSSCAQRTSGDRQPVVLHGAHLRAVAVAGAAAFERGAEVDAADGVEATALVIARRQAGRAACLGAKRSSDAGLLAAGEAALVRLAVARV
jgi:hypothetical protein